MSFAVIQTGGKQYKVKSGEILKIEKLPDSKPETKIEFNEIDKFGAYTQMINLLLDFWERGVTWIYECG